MINIAFWNLHKNEKIVSILEEFIVEYDCDIVVLAESDGIDLGNFCNLLSLKGKDFFEIPQISCHRISVIAEKSFKDISIIRDGKYHTIMNIKFFSKEFLLTALHLRSKLHSSEKEQSASARNIIAHIEDSEKEVQHKNTIIVGDFNANPFESVCIDADCFHGIPNAQISKKNKRTVESKEYEMFYNPMWNFFGDKTVPSGTYHYNNSQIQNYYWNIFDQVMFRPQMLKHVDLNSLKIITNVGDNSLLNRNGIPNKEKYSDHLPIFFILKEDKLQ